MTEVRRHLDNGETPQSIPRSCSPLITLTSCKSGSWKVKVAQSCLTLCDPMDYTVHGILQTRTLEWVAFPFSRGSFQPRDWTQVSHIAGRFFTTWATREAPLGLRYGKRTSIWAIFLFWCPPLPFWCALLYFILDLPNELPSIKSSSARKL